VLGLEIVELVMAVEESFDIEVPDAEAQEIVTPRQLVDYLAARLSLDSTPACLSQRAFYRLRRAIRQLGPSDPPSVRPSTELARVFPRPGRKVRWQALSAALSIPLPKLRRPAVVSWVGLILVAASVVASYGTAGVGLGVLVAVSATTCVLFATRPLRLTIPFSSLGDLSHYLALHHAHSIIGPSNQWSYQSIETVAFGLIREVTGLESFDPDAHFVKDLGMT
jgi:hypothetical protein